MRSHPPRSASRPFRFARRGAPAASRPGRRRAKAADEAQDDWSYASIATHRLMLRDDIRNQAFRRGLAAAVKPGDIVLDFGAGTGILSMFAVQAGAERVYAVERTSIARLARRLLTRNGFDDRVVVMRGDISRVRLPERVDVIVSEWLGVFGVDENMLAPLVLARDRWLKEGGRLVPATVTAWIAPLWSDEVELDMALQSGRPYDLDLSLVAPPRPGDFLWSGQVRPADVFAAEPAMLWTTDVQTVSVDEAGAPFEAARTLTAARDGRINALTTWFSADFGDGVSLTNRPTSPATHWGQYSSSRSASG